VYLVFTTNAFALLGLRALYFLLVGLLDRLVHLHYGLALVLGFIGVKLILHYVHGVWPAVPAIPTLMSLGVIVVVLSTVTLTSLRATRGRPPQSTRDSARLGQTCTASRTRADVSGSSG
jgi:tellurite resistance protein TerC